MPVSQMPGGLRSPQKLVARQAIFSGKSPQPRILNPGESGRGAILATLNQYPNIKAAQLTHTPEGILLSIKA